MECWCCGRGPEPRNSDWACPKCAAHGAQRHKLNDQEVAQLNRSWKFLWNKDAWLAAHPGQKWED
jgi:hypothetical protein